MLSASEKAGLLVTGIKDKVELNPKNYHKFVDHLRRYRRMYRDIVEIFDDEYYSWYLPIISANIPSVLGFKVQK